MITFTSEKRSEGYEDLRFLNVYISPSVHQNKTEDWYQVTDTRTSWKNNDTWIRVIKRDATRINFAKKSQMTAFDREVEKYINDTYPLPQ